MAVSKYKEKMVKELEKKLDGANHLFVTSFTRVKAKELEGLRNRLQSSSSSYIVVKNSLFKKALEKKGIDKFGGIESKGTLGIGLIGSDPVGPSKAFVEFAKDHETFILEGGMLEGSFIAKESIRELAALPPKEVLIAKAVGGIKSPINRLVYSLNGLISKLAIALNEVVKKKSEGGK